MRIAGSMVLIHLVYIVLCCLFLSTFDVLEGAYVEVVKQHS